MKKVATPYTSLSPEAVLPNLSDGMRGGGRERHLKFLYILIYSKCFRVTLGQPESGSIRYYRKYIILCKCI